MKELQNIYSRPGKVEYLWFRTTRLESVKILEKVEAIKDLCLQGDHYQNPGGTRQVTLIQAEPLEVIASLLSRIKISPEMTRRNIVVRGLNLLSLKEKQFKIGEAVFEYSGECHPCSRMEKSLGIGGYNAMRGLGGITAKVIRSGSIMIGDRVEIESNTI